MGPKSDSWNVPIGLAADSGRPVMSYSRPMLRSRSTRSVGGFPLLDVILAALLLVGGLVEVAVTDSLRTHAAVAGAAVVGMAVPLLWRRSAALATMTIVLAAAVAQLVLTGIPTSAASTVAWVVVVYSSAAYSPMRRALVGIGVIGAATAVFVTLGPPPTLTDVLAATLFSDAVPWLAGAFRSRHLRAARLEQLAERLMTDQREEARRAVAEERAKIARELHDIVAHAVSVIVVQAEAGEAQLATSPERAGIAFRAIQDSGREALGEMRRLLGLLRGADGAPEAVLSPLAGLARLESLVDQVRGTGLSVTLAIDGEPARVPPGIDLSLFRIVQEGLTNTLKHASASSAQVTLRYRDRTVEIELVDDGSAEASATNGGHGLVGMKERVAIFGGELSAGPRPEGGFGLRARLPLGRDWS